MSVVVSAFSSFRSFTTVSPGLVNLYKAEVVFTTMIMLIKMIMSTMAKMSKAIKTMIISMLPFLTGIEHSCIHHHHNQHE